jgi:hypothetical protein
MKSTEVILTPDYPSRGTFWPQFSKKRHPEFGNRAFQSPIGSLAPFPCPEMATFSNDTEPFSGTHGQVAGWGYRDTGTGLMDRDPKPGEVI